MGLAHLSKTAKAIQELAEKGMAPDQTMSQRRYAAVIADGNMCQLLHTIPAYPFAPPRTAIATL